MSPVQRCSNGFVTLEALQYTGKNARDIYEFAGQHLEDGFEPWIVIITTGPQRLSFTLSDGDWLVRGPTGTYQKFKTADFHKLFQLFPAEA